MRRNNNIGSLCVYTAHMFIYMTDVQEQSGVAEPRTALSALPAAVRKAGTCSGGLSSPGKPGTHFCWNCCCLPQGKCLSGSSLFFQGSCSFCRGKTCKTKNEKKTRKKSLFYQAPSLNLHPPGAGRSDRYSALLQESSHVTCRAC